MLNYKNFQLENYILKSISKDDVNDIFELFSNNAHCENFRPAFSSLEESAKLIEKINRGKANNTIFNWGIYIKNKQVLPSSKGKMIGLILFEKNALNQAFCIISDYCLEIIINENYTRKNIAFEALSVVVDYLLKLNSFKYVSAWSEIYNLKAIYLFKKLGFKFLGINRNEKIAFYKMNENDENLEHQISQIGIQKFVPINFSPYFFNPNYINLFNKFPEIETENLKLTHFSKNDAKKYQQLINENDISIEFYGPISLQNSFNYVTYSFAKGFLECEYITWAITLKSTGELIGARTLYIDRPEKPVVTQAFIGYRYRNRGYHQEGLKAIISLVSELNFPGIVANCSVGNEKIIHILTKAGFSETPIIPNFIVTNRKKFYLPIND